MGENVTILEWPSYSPDLDPIENVWKCIKDEINQKCKKNIEEMMREVASYWDSTSLKLIHNFIDSVTRWIQYGNEMEGGLKKFCKSEILMKIPLCSK